MTYLFNPHRHVKIWLSKNPNVFMNLENQMRLIEMRSQNPHDVIHLVFDSSLLNEKAQKNLEKFCQHHQISSVDIQAIQHTELSKEENELLDYYHDEIQHLKEGGNLAVASDILRWVKPIYQLGSYTDFDVPVNTQDLPDVCEVKSPILLNIGSLKIGENELILSNNDFISIVDAKAAEEKIKFVQRNVLKTLRQYHTDFIESATAQLGADHFLYTRFSRYMGSRAESQYMSKSEKINRQYKKTSRELRGLICEVTSNPQKYIEFNRISEKETDAQVIQRLRQDMKEQLNFIKWFFFNKEYHTIQTALKQNDDKFVAYCARRDRSLYIKSIVVCTTGPIAIAKALFGHYVLNSSELNEKVVPAAAYSYRLNEHFESQNSIELHENVLSMLRFLGKEDGELNDSSWLEEGEKLQQSRETVFFEKLQNDLYRLKSNAEQRLYALENPKFGFSFVNKNQLQAERFALQNLLACFINDNTVDLELFFSLTQHAPQKLTYKTTQIMQKNMGLQALLKQLKDIDLTSVPQNPFIKHQGKNCIEIKPQYNFSLKSEKNQFVLIKNKTKLSQLLNFLLFPIELIRWMVSFILVRVLRELILAPSQVKSKRTIHHIAMENPADDFVIVNLERKTSLKRLKDRFFKLSELLGFDHQANTMIQLQNPDHKKHLDQLIAAVNKLRTGQSKEKRCEEKAFPWHKIKFKGLEQLDTQAREYFLKKVNYNETESVKQTPHLEFFKLNTQDGSILDSLAVSVSESKTPISERKYVINCIEREQNYINWIKDATQVAKKTDATVILFNYRGIDESRGVIWTQDNLVTDAVSQVQRLLALGVKAQNITLEGNCLGGAIATIAAAHLHEQGYPVKLYSLRSFQSIRSFLIGYFMPVTLQSSSVLNQVKYTVATMIATLLSPLLYLGGWSLNAKAAWDLIPQKDKDYGVVCAKPNPKQASENELDGIIHHSYASIAGHIEEKRARVLVKQKSGQELSTEENNMISDNPSHHYFGVSENANTDDNEARQAKIKQFGRNNHFAPRHSLRQTTQPKLGCYDHLARLVRA